MKDKLAQTCMAVGNQLFTSQSLAPQGLNLTPAKAFSVAEAMIALLIGTIVLGFSAPMISRQIKYNNMSEVQMQVLFKK